MMLARLETDSVQIRSVQTFALLALLNMFVMSLMLPICSRCTVQANGSSVVGLELLWP
jgi:hypothetical protein